MKTKSPSQCFCVFCAFLVPRCLFDAGFSSFSSRLALEHIVAKDIFSSHPFTEFWREGLLSTRARKCQDCT